VSIKIVTPLQPVHSTDGSAYNTFTTFQDVSPQPQLVIPQQSFEVGLRMRLEAWGEASTTGTPTLSIGFFFNGAASTTVIGTGTAPTTILAQYTAVATASAIASFPWYACWVGTLRVVGVGATASTWQGAGYVDPPGSALTAFAARQPIPSTKALRTVTCDCGASRAVGVGAAWGTSSASNIIQVNTFSVELLTGY